MTANHPSGQPVFEFQPDGQPTRAAMMRAQTPHQSTQQPAPQPVVRQAAPANETLEAILRAQQDTLEAQRQLLAAQAEIIAELKEANKTHDGIRWRLSPVAAVSWLAVFGAGFWLFLYIIANGG